MKKILGILFALAFAVPVWATDPVSSNVAIVDGGAVVGAANPLHVTGSVVPGSGFSAGANPTSIVPTGKGAIWYTDKGSHCGSGASACSDANTCSTPLTACLTVQGMVNKMTSGAGDVGYIMPGVYGEAVTTVGKDNVTLIGLTTTPSNERVYINAPTATGPAITATGKANRIQNITFDQTDVAAGTTAQGGTETLFDQCTFYAEHGAGLTLINGPNGVSNSIFFSTNNALDRNLVLTGVEGWVTNNTFYDSTASADITGNGSQYVIFGNHFTDPDKAAYITLGGTGFNVDSNYFQITTGPPTAAQVGFVGGNVATNGNWPNGDIGTGFVKTFAIAATAILSASPTTIMTASGSVEIDGIGVESDGTGITGGCTLINFTTDNAQGLLALFSETAANLGANKNIPATSATTALIVPFVLESGKVIKDQATVGACTGAGTTNLNLTVIGKRLTPYASIN